MDSQRRAFLKSGLSVGAAASTRALPYKPSSSDRDTQPLDPPREASVLMSKDYGRKRLLKVQRAIKESKLDALIVSNRALDYVSYVSNLHPYPLQPALALLPADGAPVLYVHMYSTAHTRALRPIVWIEDLVDVPRDQVSEGSNINLFKECVSRLRSLRLSSARVGLAGEELDWLLPYYFRDQLPRLHLEDSNHVLSGLVVVKDKVELALMRHSQRFIDEVTYPVYLERLVPDSLDAHVYAEVMHRMLEKGADAGSQLLIDAAPPGSGTWASGVRNRRLQKGDIILSEPMPTVLGYQTEKMFTFALGKSIPDPQKRGAQVVHDSLLLALDEMKPGRELTPIIEKCISFMKSHGYDGFTVPLVHWIGSQNHEGPRLTIEGSKGWVLQPGMVLSWHPNIVVPGEVRASSSSCFLITEGGVENMSKIPLEPIYYL